MKKYLPLSLLIMTIALILIFSSQNGDQSNGISNSIAIKIETFLNEQSNNHYNAEDINFIVRKLAHFTEYLILEVLLVICFMHFLKKLIPAVLASGFLGVSLAFFDEYLQKSSGERTSALFDIMLDCMGIVIGVIVCVLFVLFYQPGDKRVE